MWVPTMTANTEVHSLPDKKRTTPSDLVCPHYTGGVVPTNSRSLDPCVYQTSRLFGI